MTSEIAGLAKLVGTDSKGGRIWAVDGKLLDDDEFDKLIARQHAASRWLVSISSRLPRSVCVLAGFSRTRRRESSCSMR